MTSHDNKIITFNSNNQNKQHAEYIEDALSISPNIEKTLDDEQLYNHGLIKTTAYVRSKRSKNALRIEKTRAKKAEQGIKQLNIEVPDQEKDNFKQLAKAVIDGMSIEDAFNSVIGHKKSTDVTNRVQNQPTSKPSSPACVTNKQEKSADARYNEHDRQVDKIIIEYGQKIEKIKTKGGFKAFLLRLMGIV
jgi:uncharacterized membrane protein (UPF0182 family)